MKLNSTTQSGSNCISLVVHEDKNDSIFFEVKINYTLLKLHVQSSLFVKLMYLELK